MRALTVAMLFLVGCPITGGNGDPCGDPLTTSLESGRYVYTIDGSTPAGVIDQLGGPAIGEAVLDVDTEAGTLVLTYELQDGEQAVVTWTMDEIGPIERY